MSLKRCVLPSAIDRRAFRVKVALTSSHLSSRETGKLEYWGGYFCKLAFIYKVCAVGSGLSISYCFLVDGPGIASDDNQQRCERNSHTTHNNNKITKARKRH